MRTTVVLCAVAALLADTIWAPHSAYQKVSVRGAGFEKRTTVPAVYEDRPQGPTMGGFKTPPKGVELPGEPEPRSNRVEVSPEKVIVEPLQAYRPVCYLGHMLRVDPNAVTPAPVSVEGVSGVEVRVDYNRQFTDYSLILVGAALLLQLIALIPPDPDVPPRPSPWPEPAPPPATEQPQPASPR